MKKISTRQLIIFYCIYSFSIKFLMLPSLLADTAGADCLFSALVGTVIELVILYLALTVITMNQDTDIYSALRGKSKKALSPRAVGAKFVMVLMFFIFCIQIFILINQAFHLLNDNIFENISPQLFCIPMLVLGIFFCFMPARAIFRSGELFFIFIIIGIALAVFPALTQINPAEILPIFDNGAEPFANGFYTNLIYFESSFMLLMFCGDIKIEKHFKKKFMSVAVLVGVFFVFFVFMFYSLFGPLAHMKNVAITDMTLYSSSIAGGGRLDWVLVTMWLLLLLLRFGITFFCAFSCLRYITQIKHRAGILGFVLAVVIYCISIFVFATSRDLNNFINAIPWLIAVLVITVPLLLFINSLVMKRRARNV